MKNQKLKKRKPTHPGAILREDILPSLSMSQGDIAIALGVSRRTVSQIIHEHRPITADMAIRLARFLGGTPDSWLNMQQALDIWLLVQERGDEYDGIEAVDKAA